ncbi:YdbL family protein [Marinobacterium sp. 3-1745]|uniref:YdbL family protein n=2 Tax=Marinobacterium marinum TaxID=2756129 RepID=A0A7W1WW69_9GAMM|nr:YdbL family protein [Marinobacterium marinum]
MSKIYRSIAAAMMALMLSLPAYAISLDDAKAQGLVGERSTGYLGTVTAAPGADVKQLVEQINSKRRALYQQKASKAGVELEVMELRTGERLQQMTPAGEYIQNANGRWVRK